MAVSSGFYNSVSGDRKYTAEQLSSIFDGIIEDGVYASIYDATDESPKPFKIVPDEEHDLTVIVKKGRCWFNHTWLYNDGDISLTLSAAPSSGQSRIDTVVIRVDTEDRINTIEVLAGTAASSDPVASTLSTGTNGVYEYELGKIEIDSSTTIISSTDIDQTAIGTTTPYVTAPVQSISLSDYLGTWNDQFDNWLDSQESRVDNFMANISGLMTQEQATYLQLQIDSLHMIQLTGEYDVTTDALIGKYVVCTNGVRTFTATTTDSGEVVFEIGDRRADSSQGIAYDSCLGSWSMTMYKSSSDLTPLGSTQIINTYYYGNYPAVTIGGEIEPEYDLAFGLTVNGTTYTFDENSASSSVSNVYNYVKDANSDNWYLIVYSDASIIFTSLTTNLDVCAVGGGGGGGGAYANATSSSVKLNDGSNGGGGYYQQLLNTAFTEDSTYSISIGAGGSRGTGSGTNTGSTSNGGAGGASSITLSETSILTANGGPGGKRGTSSGAGAAVTGGSAQYCFSDSTYPSVSGANRNSYKGGGGKKGTASGYWNNTGSYQNGGNGTAGAKGLVILRNART